MLQFLVKRFIGLVFVVICITFITFLMGYFAPGDPIKVLLGTHFNAITYAQLRHTYGLDLPWYQQYFNFLTGLFRLDFGYSMVYQEQPVWSIIQNGIGPSTELSLWGLILTFALGIPLGIYSAIKANQWQDTLNMGIMLVFWGVPVFVFAIYFQIIIVWLHKTIGLQWPIANWGTTWAYTPQDIQYKIGPIVIFALTGVAGIARFARTSVLEVLRQDYVRTARAKGLKERIVIYRHALRNALLPIVSIFGAALGGLVSGVFFIEAIFNIPGLGSTGISAISNRDYPLIQATVVIGAVAVVIGNMIADILYSLIDPRIRAE